MHCFYIGCQKEQLNPVSADYDEEAVYMISDLSHSAVSKLDVSLAELQNGFQQTTATKTSNFHAHANYTSQPLTGFYSSLSVKFSITENKNGIVGNGHYTRTWEDTLGNVNTFTIKLNTDCYFVADEDLIYSGTLTGVTGVSPFNPPLPVGSRFWIKVRDNGSGPKADPDQYHPVVFFNTSGLIPCNAFDLNAPVWSIPVIGEMTDVLNKSDNVKIN